MKKLLTAALLALPLSAQAGDPTGLWQTPANEDGKYLQVRVYQCVNDPANICGVIAQGFGGATQVNNGKPIIWAMQANGEDRWNHGNVWAPDTDKTYNANLTLNGNTLVVQGCVAGIFCRSSAWARVE